MANSSNGSTPTGITDQPLPASHKIYAQSERRGDVQVAMRIQRDISSIRFIWISWISAMSPPVTALP